MLERACTPPPRALRLSGQANKWNVLFCSVLRHPPLFTQRSSQEPSSSQSPINVLQLACPNFPVCCVSHQPSLSSLPTTHSSWTTHTSPHYPNPLTDPVRWSLTASWVAGIRPHMSICSVIYPTRQESPKSLIRRTLSNSESPERSSFTSFKHPGLLLSLVGVIWGTWTLAIILPQHQSSPT